MSTVSHGNDRFWYMARLVVLLSILEGRATQVGYSSEVFGVRPVVKMCEGCVPDTEESGVILLTVDYFVTVWR